MTDLEMCKAIAELEGFKARYGKDSSSPLANRVIQIENENDERWDEYNPITDLALNCTLRDKYEVEIDYSIQELGFYDARGRAICIAGFSSKEEIPRAVIECILKSKEIEND